MPRKRQPRIRICENCGHQFGKERGPAAKTCSEECQRERNSARERERYAKVKGTPHWQAVRAGYLRDLQARRAVDPEVAARHLAQRREISKRHWDKLTADPAKIEAYRAQRRKWHRDLSPERRAARKYWYWSLSPELKKLFLLELRQERAYARMRATERTVMESPMGFKWTPQADALLGTMTDGKVAEQLGCAPAAVVYRRSKLGVLPFRGTEVTWNEANTPLLGVLTDTEVAAKTGLSRFVVKYERDKRGIPASNKSKQDWRPEEDALLGTMTDSELAEKLGRTVVGVRQRRVNQRIPAFKEKRSIEITPEIHALLDELAPALIERYRNAGLPIGCLEPWQITEIALKELLVSIRKSQANTRRTQ